MSIETILNEIKIVSVILMMHTVLITVNPPPPSPPAPAQHCKVSCKLKEQVANTICNVKETVNL